MTGPATDSRIRSRILTRRSCSLLAALALALASALSCERTPPDALLEQARSELRLGNLRQALAAADRGYKKFEKKPDSRLHWQFRILKAEIHLAQGRTKEAIPLLEGRIPSGPEFAELAARRRMNQAYARFLQADFRGASKLLKEASNLAPDNASPALLAEIEMRKGIVLARLGDVGAAEACLRRARDFARRAGDQYLEAAALGNLGFNLLSNTRYDEALPWFEQALVLAERTRAKKFIATTLGNLGRCYHGLGDSDKAIQLQSRAESLAAEIGDHYGRQIWLGDLGDAHYRRREYAKALEYFRRALSASRELGESFSSVAWLHSLTKVHLELGDHAAAEKSIQEALRLSAGIDSQTIRIWTRFYAGRVTAAKKDFDAAERDFLAVIASSAQAGENRALWNAERELALLYAASGSPAKADAAFRRALAAVEEARSRMQRDDWKLSFQSGSTRFYQDYVDFLMARGDSERALEVAESARARLLAQKLGLAQSPVALCSARRFRDLARSLGATLVSYWLAPRRSFVWIVRPQSIAWLALPPAGELQTLADAYSEAIRGLRDPLESGHPAGEQLHELLFAPVARLAPPGSKLVVVPDGCLHELNLESLPVSGTRRRYVVEDLTIALTPSLTVLAGSAAVSGPRRASAPLLLIGDPVAPSADYPTLPDVQAEVAAIQRRFAPRAVVITGAAAHPGAYREAQPGRFELIHFAAHATASGDSPLDSAVILSRRGESYKLYARDVLGIPLRARLVTVSACRGMGAKLYSGEGLVGFAWAFLQAGADNVIAGLWDVNDASTAALMSELYASLAAGQAPGPALRRAKLQLLRSGGAWRKPYYWAAFEIFSRLKPF